MWMIIYQLVLIWLSIHADSRPVESTKRYAEHTPPLTVFKSNQGLNGTNEVLGPYNVSAITVSGISSGAYFAVQMHIAHSDFISGAGLFAGGPYYCAEGTIEYAEEKCMDVNPLQGGGPNTQLLIDLTIEDSLLGYIDSISNLRDNKHRVFIFSGELDSVVDPVVVKALQDYYSAFLASPSAEYITTEYSVAAEHCMPTLSYGEDCQQLESPYIGKCDYDGAGAALQAIYGPQLNRYSTRTADAADAAAIVEAIDDNEGDAGVDAEASVSSQQLPRPHTTAARAATAARGSMVEEHFYSFDQRPYIPQGSLEDSRSSLGAVGYIYVPSSCSEGLGVTCTLHISFHGCHQGVQEIGDSYARYSGYNEWAEVNNIIVLYPYAEPSQSDPVNPNGCWDWWGYTGANYGWKDAPQITFVRNLIEAVTGS